MDNREKTAIVFMADGMEMCECLITVDILRRAGVKVITASVMKDRTVTASHQVRIEADVLAADADFAAADIIILPGGRVGTENLAASDIVTGQCSSYAGDSSRYVTAICAAPSVLSGIGILDGRTTGSCSSPSKFGMKSTVSLLMSLSICMAKGVILASV